jgi:hypothetical protein
MKGIGKVILLILSLVGLLSVETCASTSTQSYLFKNSVIRSLNPQHSTYLLAQQIQDSISVENNDSVKLKDPKMALFYAVIPGIVVHGAGHFYADKPVTGLVLLGVEGVGLIVLLNNQLSQTENNIDTGGSGLNIIAGITLFFGSWAYDMIGAPQAVNKHNQELIQRKNTGLKFQLKDGGLRLALVYHF